MKPVQLNFDESYKLLNAFDIPMKGKMTANLQEVSSAAGDLGYPLVLKVISESLIHKSDSGGVILNLENKDEVTAAYHRLMEKFKKESKNEDFSILVQPMAKRGFELFVGAKQDPSFGPITMIGLGGIYVELYSDAATGIGVLTRDDVLRMLSKTKAGVVLDGYRGRMLDREAVIRLTISVSRFMAENPAILELDLNPVIVHEEGFDLVDYRLIKGTPMSYPRFSQLSEEKVKSLASIFEAKSAAVIGASRPGTQGGVILKNCLGIKRLYPIHPRLKRIHGLPCYKSLQDLPEVPEVGIFAVNAERTVQIFEEFCKLGGKGAIIFSDGFAEAGREDLEEKLIELSREYNVAYIGPNCMGVIDNFSKLNTNFIPEQRSEPVTEANGIGIISQSGGIGLELLEMFNADNLGIGRWVSIGNASCVGVPEILAHMGRDPKIKLIAIYLEGVADGLKLMEIGKEVTKEKPVLVIKGGIGGGAQAALSHTASLAGSHEAFKACCDQAGFYLVEELTEDPKILVNVLSMLTGQPETDGDRIAVVSVGGGAGILIADQITEEGMHLASFAPQTKEALKELMKKNLKPDQLENSEKILKNVGNNPVDLLGNCDDDRLLETIRIIDKDPNTDLVIAAIYLQVPLLSEYLPERLVELKSELTKPLIVSARGFSEYVGRCREYLAERQVRTYTLPMIIPVNIALQTWKRYGISFN
ncbi:MAG: acetate--CoA ligase family protein [Candidatus Aminicenantes bacterium]|nr:acetate--CoA ligase family protein [Candidatus Aminicenantes bacterium]